MIHKVSMRCCAHSAIQGLALMDLSNAIDTCALCRGCSQRRTLFRIHCSQDRVECPADMLGFRKRALVREC